MTPFDDNPFADLIPGGGQDDNPFADLIPSTSAGADPFGGRLDAMSARAGALAPSYRQYATDPAPSAPLGTSATPLPIDTVNPFADLIPPSPGIIPGTPEFKSLDASGVMPSLTQALEETDRVMVPGRATGFEDIWSVPERPPGLPGEQPGIGPGAGFMGITPHWSQALVGEARALRSNTLATAGDAMPGDLLDKTGYALGSGYSQLRQTGSTYEANLLGRVLGHLNEIDRGGAPPATDPLMRPLIAGYAAMDPAGRQAFRERIQQQLGDAVWDVRNRAIEQEFTPKPPALERLTRANTFDEGWDAFFSDPLGIIGYVGTQSMVSSAPSLALGAAGRIAQGLRSAKLAGATVGAGIGSAGVEFGSSIVEAMEEGGVNLSDPQSIAAAVSNPGFMADVRQKAAIRAGVIGAFDAAGVPLAGRAMRPIGLENTRIGALAEIPPQFGMQAGTGMAGEAFGSLAAGNDINYAEVFLEGIGEAYSTPADIALARAGRGGPGATQAATGTDPAAGPGGAEPPPLDTARVLPDGAVEMPPINVTAPDPGGAGPAFADLVPPVEQNPVDTIPPQVDAVPPEAVPPVGPESVAPIEPPALQALPEDSVVPPPAAPPAGSDVPRGTLAQPPQVGQRVRVDFGDGEVETGTVERVSPFDEDGQQRYSFLLRTDDGRGIDSRDDDVSITPDDPYAELVNPLDLDAPSSPVVPPVAPPPPVGPAVGPTPAAGPLPGGTAGDPGGGPAGGIGVDVGVGGAVAGGAAPAAGGGNIAPPGTIRPDGAAGAGAPPVADGGQRPDVLLPGAENPALVPGAPPAVEPAAPAAQQVAPAVEPADAGALPPVGPVAPPAPGPAPAVGGQAPGAGAVPQAVPPEAPGPGDGAASGPPPLTSAPAPPAPAPETGRDTDETVSAPGAPVDPAANFRGRLSAGSAINHTNGRRYFVVRLENGRYRAAYREEGAVGPTILADAKTRDAALDAAVADAFPTAANVPAPPAKTDNPPDSAEVDRSAQQRRPGETVAAYQRRLGVEPGSPEGEAAATEWRRQFRAQQEANRQRMAAVDALPAPLEGEEFPDYANRNGWRPGSPEYDNGLRRWSQARDEANASRSRDAKARQDAEAKRDRDRWIGIVHSWMERASDGDILSLPDAIETEAPLVLRVISDTARDGSPRTTRRLVRVMSDGEEVLVAQSINGTFRGGPDEASLPIYGKALEKSEAATTAPAATPEAAPSNGEQSPTSQESAGTRMSDPPTSRDHFIRQIKRNGRSVPDASGRSYRVTAQDGQWRVSRHRPGERSGVTIDGLHPTREAAVAAAADDWAAAAAMDAAAQPPTAAPPESVDQQESQPEAGGQDGTEQLRPEVSRAPESRPAGDVPPPAGEPETGGAPAGDRERRAGDARPADRPTPADEPAAPGSGGVDGPDAVRGVVEPDGRGNGAERSDPAPERGGPAEPEPGADRPADRPVAADRDAADGVVGTNFQISESEEVASGGEKTRARQNIAAIRLLREIEASGRPATREQQRTLSKFVGWGGIPQIFRDTKGAFRKGWEALGEELESLLSAEELADARRSTINAHYTSGEVIRAMWRAAVDMGFAGGRVLEPSMGVGHFFGMMPPDVAGRSTLAGVELDRITGGIAKALYPQANVQIQGFQAVDYPADFFDVVIGNVPFSGTIKPHDPVHNKGGKLLLHDYFFAKSLAVTRPGGLLMLITSKGTMDKQDAAFRRQLAASADLLGAIRLPNTAFKGNAGTEVTTDLLILRKRAPGAPAIERPWFDLAAVPPDNLSVNEYFARHPEQMLGTMRAAGSMYRADEATLVPDTSTPLADQLARALRAISSSTTPMPSLVDQAAAAAAPVQAAADAEFAPSSVPEGAYYLNDDGEIRQRTKGVGVAVTVPKASVPRIKALIDIRDAARRVLDVQRADGSDAENKAAQRVLGDAYDAFVRKYGPINRTRKSERPHPTKPDEVIVQRRYPNLSDFTDDPGIGLVRALEIYDEDTDTARKADIFTKRVLDPKRDIREVKTPADALLASLTDRGRIDLPWMAERLGTDEASVLDGLDGLLFRDPDTRSYVEAEEYLSGNVRRKLAIAKAAAAADPAFESNVRALEQAQPEDIPASKIYASLGASWISPDVIAQFSKDVLGVAVRVGHVALDASWSVEPVGGEDVYGTANAVEYGTIEWPGIRLLEAGLNQKAPKVWDRGDPPRVDLERTAAVQEKMSRIREAFNEWMWADPDRSDAQARIYNDTMNNTRLRTYDGSHLTFPGMSATVELRRHQKDAVWRALRSGNTLFAHVVGAGKTMAMIAHVMEGRRTGLLRKPMIVVPNHMLEQFSREFLQLYPGANIMVADKTQFHGDKRRAFVARVATNEWDAIVTTHSAFGMIGMSPEYQAEYLRNEIAAYKEILIEAAGNKITARGERDNPTVKRIEGQIAAMEERLRKMMAAENKDRGLSFEDLGVDHLTVDEAHFAKSLQIVTKMDRVRGLSTTMSQRATDLFLKSRYLDGLNPGRSLVFATATPITNTLSEMFTMQRYMQYPLLQEQGLAAFDAWAATFGETITTIDVKAAGAGFEQVTKFARFKNVPELLTMFLSFADIKTAEMLGLPTPTLRTGNAQVIGVPPTAAQRAAVQELLARLALLKSGGRRGAQKGADNVLVVTTDGRKVANDMRLMDPTLPDEGGTKIDRAVDRIFDIWERGTPTKRTQIVFSDFGTPGDGKSFSIYDDIKRKLVERGVPAKEIAFIHDAGTDVKKARLFADVRSGKVRVLIGSTEKMGVGTNVQTRLIAMHHIDAPWRPADIEQRDGRIMRQGNENPEVEIYRYVTEGTFDAYMWQTLETKARFIAQIMRGDLSQRETEDVDEVTLDYATAKAIASGNPLVARAVALDAQISRLARLRSAHRDEQDLLRSRVRSTTAAIPENRALIAKLDRDIKAAEPLLKAKTVTSGQIGNSSYSDEKAFGEALLAAALPQEGIRPSNGEVIGRIGSFDIVAGLLHPRYPDETRDFFLRGASQHPFVVERINGQALVNRMTVALGRMEKRKAMAQEQIVADEKRLRDMEAKIGQPFRQAEELEKAIAEMADLRQKIREQETAEAAAARGTPAPPAATPDDEPMAAAPLDGPERLTERVLNDIDGSNEEFMAEWPGGQSVALHPIAAGYRDELEAWETRLQAVVDQVLGADRVELRGAADLYVRPEAEQRAGGLYYRTQNLIYVALSIDEERGTEVARHEAMHAAWNLGLLTDREKATMTAAVQSNPRWRAMAEHIRTLPLYRGKSDADIAEEVSAYMWEDWRRGRLTGIASIDAAFIRLARLIDAVREFLRQQLGVVPDVRDLFTMMDRGGLSERPSTFAQEGLAAAGPDAAERVRQDKSEIMAAAALPDGIEVEEKRAVRDMNAVERFILRPIEAFRRWPALQGLIRKGIAAEQRMSNHINRLNRQLDRVVAKLSTEEFEQLGSILFMGDAEETTFSRSELAADGVAPKVIDAYVRTRDLLETIGRYVDQHRRSMMPQVLERKAAVLRRMARLTNMADPEFRKLYGRRARLREKLRAGTGDPQTIARELDKIEEALTAIRADLPEYMELQAEADRLEARLASTSVRRREGYVPHKFFGSWRVFVKGPPDADGNPTMTPIAGPHGFFPGRQQAIGAARLYKEANPAAELVVAPVEFKFPESDATQLSDRAYGRFVGRISDMLQLQGQELQDAIKGVARRRFRRRIAGFAQYRTGVQGYSKNLDRVLRTHIGEAVRYVAMDRLKFEAITTMEAMGLSPARRENQETQVLQAAINAWFRDVNGQKQPMERSIDQMLDKLEETPLRLPLVAGATIAASLGMAGSWVLGPLLGSYIGYRLYRGITSGGEFKTRATTGAMLSDMAHLKLGAFFNVFSAAVNLSQIALATYPKLGEKWTMVGVGRAVAALTAARLGKDSADAKLLERADIDPKFASTEASPHLFEKQSAAARWSMLLFSSAETMNRSVTFLGAYHRAIANGTSPGVAMATAKRLVTETQFHYGAANKPELLRNQLLRVPLQFKNFMVQMFSFMFGLRGAGEIARFAVALTLMAGLFGAPGWEWLDWLVEAVTGMSMKREIIRQGLLAQHAGETYGTVVDFLARGFPAILGVDLSARTGMGDMLPNEGRDFLGPWIGTGVQAIRIGQQNSTIVDQVRNLSPGLGNPLKSLEAAADGIPLGLALARAAGLGDGPSGFGNDRALMTNPWKRGFFDYEPTTGELWLRAMGGRPKREADIQGYEQIKLKDTEELRKREGKYLDRITAALRAAGSNPDSPAFKTEQEAILKEAAADKRVSISREQVRNVVRNAVQDRGDRGMRTSPRELRPELMKLRDAAYGKGAPRPETSVGEPRVAP